MYASIYAHASITSIASIACSVFIIDLRVFCIARSVSESSYRKMDCANYNAIQGSPGSESSKTITDWDDLFEMDLVFAV